MAVKAAMAVRNRVTDTDQEADSTTIVLFAGVILTCVGFLAVILSTPFHWLGLLWSFSLFAVGIFAGFIFSVSRVVENEGAGTSSTAAVRYLPNTGLEQIADWLTKIIVGLTLVELQKIPPTILAFSLIIGASLGDTATIRGLAYAMIVFFPVMGFLSMYLSTRLYLNQRIRMAESDQFFSVAVAAAVDNPQTSLKDPNRGVTAAVTSTATDIVTVPLAKLNTPTDIAAWARAQSVLGAWPAAVEGYKKAISLDPNDPKLRLDYAVALYTSGAPPDTVVEQLQAGIQRVDPSKDADLASRLQQSLILAYLYVPPPDGFTKAIATLQNLLSTPLPKRAVIYYYAACAYGQQYSYLQSRANPDQPAVADARSQVLEFTRRALDLDPSLVSQFRMVSDPNAREKSKVDNDLEPFFTDPEFRALVWDGTPPPQP